MNSTPRIQIDVENPATTQIIYGDSNSGLKSLQGPKSLTISECYVVHASFTDSPELSRSAVIGFRIASDGKVLEMSPSEYEKVFSK